MVTANLEQIEGAKNLLLNCVEARPGQSILIAGEDIPDAHFDPALYSVVADVAQSFGLEATVVIGPETKGREDFPEQVSEAIADTDQTILFTRLGDQNRFSPTPGNTYSAGEATDNLDRWNTVAYGSPRFTHFHACGADPGDIAFTMIDTTISFDGVEYWRDGEFVFLREPEVQALIARHPSAGVYSPNRQEIGL